MKKPFTRALCLLAVAAGMLCVATKSDASNKNGKSKKRPITKLKVDPTAKRVKMFDALNDGTVTVKVIAKGPLGGKLLFENKTDQPVTIEMPDAFVGVQIVNQLGGGGGLGGGGQGGFGGGGGQQGGGGQGFGGGGGGQQGGGGFGGGQGGGLGGGGGGGGFFSIPPERVVAFPYNSVCLEHGKADPTPRMTYKLIPVEEFTKDARLQELCKLVGTGRLNPASAQAAAWHLSDKMSWQQLAQKQVIRSTSRTPYFSTAQLQFAQRIVGAATGRARELAQKAKDKKKSGETTEEKAPPRKFR